MRAHVRLYNKMTPVISAPIFNIFKSVSNLQVCYPALFFIFKFNSEQENTVL